MRTCESCGNETDQPSYCERCGAALPVDVVEDTALSLMLGLVCNKCDSYNEPQSSTCTVCGEVLKEEDAGNSRRPSAPPEAGAPPTWMSAPDGAPLATSEAMPAVDLASLKAAPTPVNLGAPAELPELEPIASPPCVKCGAELEVEDKFCRECGTRVGEQDQPPAQSAPAGTLVMSAVNPVAASGPAATQMMGAVNPAVLNPSSTLFMGAVAPQRLARLVLMKGSSSGGANWRLPTGETTIGRRGVVNFGADPHLADSHARIILDDSGLTIVPEDQRNGVFVSIANKVNLEPGTEFVIGNQRMVATTEDELDRALPAEQEGSPLLASITAGPPNIMLRRIFSGGQLHELYVRPQRLITIGRSLCDINFPQDPYLSVRHAQVVRSAEGYVLEDLGSRNGTYLRVTEPQALKHGDAVMIGDQVLRVELSA